MKYILALSTILLLTGCGYDYNDLTAAKFACTKASGKFSTSEWSNGQIMNTYCSIDGVKYRIGRSSYDFLDGQRETN